MSRRGRAAHALSDGSTLRVRVSDSFTGPVLFTAEATPAGPKTQILWDGSFRLYLVGTTQLVPISCPSYGYAEDRVTAEDRALSFFADSAEATISYANRAGIAVSECYA